MNVVKQVFSIKDLEYLCGIKAHTIRIWEKRYNLLHPERTDTNIRVYNLKSLQKLLNVTYLVNSGYKISRVSKWSKDEIEGYVRGIVNEKSAKNQALNSFKIAMLNYDQELFLGTYEQLSLNKTFHEIFYDVFIPFLNDIGLLWQSNTISPSQEHFITNLIKQKLLINIDTLQLSSPQKTNKLFILFLPENEIHDLGLLFVHYELLYHGYRSIFLGHSVPLESLPSPNDFDEDVVFLSYFTVKPEQDHIVEYMKAFNQIVGNATAPEFWILGRQVQHLPAPVAPNHHHFKSIFEITKHL